MNQSQKSILNNTFIFYIRKKYNMPTIRNNTFHNAVRTAYLNHKTNIAILSDTEKLPESVQFMSLLDNKIERAALDIGGCNRYNFFANITMANVTNSVLTLGYDEHCGAKYVRFNEENHTKCL